MANRELIVHKKTCPHKQLPCLFTKHGCTELVQRQHMNQHLSQSKHMTLLLKEIDNLHTTQSNMQQTIHSLKMELQDSQKAQSDMRQTIQSLEAKIISVKENYSQIAISDVGRLEQLQKQSQIKNDRIAQNYQQLMRQASLMEQEFQLHKKTFEDFILESNRIQDSIIQASTTLPLGFIINNTEELVNKGEGFASPYFYTVC